MNKKKMTMTMALALGAGLLLTHASEASAASSSWSHDYYSGVSCVADGTNQSNIKYWWGRANNPSSSSVGFNCAITRPVACCDSSLKIHVIDRHYSKNFSCQFRGYNPEQHPSYWYRGGSTSGSSSKMKKISIGDVSGNFRYLYCSVPGTYSGNGSYISGYEHVQN